MINKVIKILASLCIILTIVIFYLSFYGIKTEKFNDKIISKVSDINKSFFLELKSVKFLLNPFNFTINVETKDSEIKLDNNNLKLKNIKTNISLKSLINNDFSIDDLQILTRAITINDAISLARSFKNSPQLFILDNIIKDGFLVADINLNFDTEGNIKDDYQIDGFIKNGKVNFLNKYNIENLNFIFEIKKNKYSLKKIITSFNEINLSAPLIEVIHKNSIFLVNGKISTEEKNIDTKKLSTLFKNDYRYLNIEKVNFSSNNEFSFNLNKKFKFNDLDIKSKISLKHLYFKDDLLNLKKYFPNYKELTRLENHKITIRYNKNKLDIEGQGEILIDDNYDNFNYKISREKNQYKFNTNININKNPLEIDFLDYKKNENLDSLVTISGTYKKNSYLKFDLISFQESKNKIYIKNLNLNDDFKIDDIDEINLDYTNNDKINNKIFLKKDNKKYIIKGKSFDASKIINELIDSDDKNISLFSNLNEEINININKTYINKNTFVNNLSGNINFKANKVNNLNLESIFPNQKKLTLSIKTNLNNEKITTLFTNYPKPLIQRYKFINGFEGGILDFYSIEKKGVSNSILTIDNFKVKEVPVFAKLLSLASLQGIADLLTGEGIRFTDFEMKFSNEKGLMTIEELYSIGPAVSILMDGYIDKKNLISLRGTLVPATTINRTIASIPLIGNILVGKKTGEGVFGVSFKIKGQSNNLKTTVNPVKTLTPRFITRTLEKIKKN
tara:strand:+ start:552 stop:2750 length:2199 start_codon:yes stop_codon:yes gene_type:complete